MVLGRIRPGRVGRRRFRTSRGLPKGRPPHVLARFRAGLDGAKGDLEPVFGLLDRERLPLWRVVRFGHDVVSAEQVRHQQLDLHVGEADAKTLVRSTAEGNPGKVVVFLLNVFGEALRVKAFGVLPVLRGVLCVCLLYTSPSPRD